MPGLSIAGIILAIIALFTLIDPVACSHRCKQTVKSEREARAAVATFFSTDTGLSRRLIASLRRDGMTDEYLNALKAGCTECYVRAGDPDRNRNEDPAAWYAIAGIAPPSAKRDVVLLIECRSAVWLDHTLYGG